MALRGTFQDGMVILDQTTGLRDGDVVEVVPACKAEKNRKKPVPLATNGRVSATKSEKPLSPAAKKRLVALTAFFGMWKDRPDWKGKSTLQIQRELRRKAMGVRKGMTNTQIAAEIRRIAMGSASKEGATSNGSVPNGTTSRKPRRDGKSGESSDPLPGFGMWKDRPDWKGKSTARIVRELREKAMGRG